MRSRPLCLRVFRFKNKYEERERERLRFSSELVMHKGTGTVNTGEVRKVAERSLRNRSSAFITRRQFRMISSVGRSCFWPRLQNWSRSQTRLGWTRNRRSWKTRAVRSARSQGILLQRNPDALIIRRWRSTHVLLASGLQVAWRMRARGAVRADRMTCCPKEIRCSCWSQKRRFVFSFRGKHLNVSQHQIRGNVSLCVFGFFRVFVSIPVSRGALTQSGARNQSIYSVLAEGHQSMVDWGGWAAPQHVWSREFGVWRPDQLCINELSVWNCLQFRALAGVCVSLSIVGGCVGLRGSACMPWDGRNVPGS